MFHLAVAFAYERFSFLFTLAPRRVYQPSQRPLLICPMKPEVCTLPARNKRRGFETIRCFAWKSWSRGLFSGSGAGLEPRERDGSHKITIPSNSNQWNDHISPPSNQCVFELFPSHYKIPKCWTKKRKFFCFAYPDFFQSKRTLNNFMGRRFNAECDECFERQDF